VQIRPTSTAYTYGPRCIYIICIYCHYLLSLHFVFLGDAVRGRRRNGLTNWITRRQTQLSYQKGRFSGHNRMRAGTETWWALLKIEARDGQFAKQISVYVSLSNFDFIYYQQPHFNEELDVAFVKIWHVYAVLYLTTDLSLSERKHVWDVFVWINKYQPISSFRFFSLK